MATVFETLYPSIKLRAYGASEPLIEMYLRETAIDFCEKTYIWTRLVEEYAFEGDGRITLANIEEGQEELEAVIPGVYNTYRVLGVPPINMPGSLNAFAGLTFDGESRGAPQYIYQIPEEENTLAVWPIPDKQYSNIVFTIVLKPANTATTLPDFLAKHYRDALIEGTLARLYQVVGQPFYNPQAADKAEIKYARARLDARVSANRGRAVAGNLQVTANAFATGHR
jgi:hypothetical protein